MLPVANINCVCDLEHDLNTKYSFIKPIRFSNKSSVQAQSRMQILVITWHDRDNRFCENFKHLIF